MAIFKNCVLILVILTSALSCNSQAKNELEAVQNIPKDAIKIEIQNGRYKMPVILNDSTYAYFGLDNGISNLILDSVFIQRNATKLHLTSEPKVIFNLSFLSGTKRSQISLDTLRIGMQSETLVYKSLIACPNMNDLFFRDQIAGILPLRFLGQKKMIYIDPKLEFLNLIDSIDLDSFTPIPFSLNGSGTFIIKSDILINTKDTSLNFNGNFMIDFGFPRDEIRLNKNMIGKIKYQMTDEIELSDLKGKPSYIKALYPDLIHLKSFGNSLFENYKVTFFTPIDNNNFYMGVIGAKILERFITIIDYKNNILYLKEHQNHIASSLVSRNIGITITAFPKKENSNDTTNCKWIVTRLTKNSIADSSNIKLLDELVSVDGSSIENYSLRNGENIIKKSTKFIFKENNKLKTLTNQN